APAKKAAPVKAAPVIVEAVAVAVPAPTKKSAPAKKSAAASKEQPAPVDTEPPQPAKLATAMPPMSAPVKAAPRRPVVREDESPWTTDELKGVRRELDLEIGRLHDQISDAEEGIADLLRDSGDGAGDDQADAGTKTFEREHEMSLANNARVLLEQNERALARLNDGTYGICERCELPIGKFRLQAFPRVTLCVSCKQLEERR
ncbi:MAG: TraR/DksA C4-type zinc finger protein, partial [Actinomycetes bacterium]